MRSPTSSHTAARSSSGLIVVIDGLFANHTDASPPRREAIRCIPSEVFELRGWGDGWPEAETIVLPACASRPSFGENQTDESASNRKTPLGPRTQRVPSPGVSG